MDYRDQFPDEFQFHLVALIVQDADFLPRWREVISPDYFTEIILQDIVTAAIEFYDDIGEAAGGSILKSHVHKKVMEDPVRRSSLQTYMDTMDDLAGMKIENPEYLIQEAAIFARKQAVEQAYNEAALDIRSGDYEGMLEKLTTASAIGTNLDDLGTFHFRGAEMRAHQYATGQGPVRIPTGIHKLDLLLDGGGLGVGELGVVAAAPKRGKSMSLINFGCGALFRGHTVFHYTLELRAHAVHQRYDMRLTGMNKMQLRAEPTQFLEKIMETAASKKGQLLVKEYPAKQASAKDIMAHVRATAGKENVKPDLILVDYLGEMRSSRQYDARRFEISHTTSELRALATVLEVPLWTAMQTNRSALWKDNIDMEDLAECFDVAMIADVLTFMSQTREERTKNPPEVRFHMINRELHSSGSVLCIADYEHARIVGA